MSEWLIPWTERGRSGAIRDNFLWRLGERLYVMDNHRLALWCWWQHLEESEYWTYLHVDRHYDALWQTFNPWPEHTREIHHSELAAFRTAEVMLDGGGESTPLYRWDAITSALWSLHSERIQGVTFATADEGDFPAIPRAQQISPWQLPAHVAYLAEPAEEGLAPRRIIDIDIDYFARHDLEGAFGPVFSTEYIGEIGRALRSGLDSGSFGVVTIALSPETTGSWALAERLLGSLLSPFSEYDAFLRGAPRE